MTLEPRAATTESNVSLAILDHLPIGVVVVDSEMTVSYWNACLEEWTGIASAKMVGRDLREKFPHFGKKHYETRLRQLFDGGPPALFSSQLHPHLFPAPQPSGRMRVLNTLAVPVPARSGEGHDAILAVQDVSSLAAAMVARREAQAEAERQAATDPLTGLWNRRHFFSIADKAIAQARRHGHPCALMMVDVDDLKDINDRHGHAAGDDVLRELVGVFDATLRKSDLVARLGGDEFGILLPETGTDTALATAERLLETIHGRNLAVGDDVIALGVSIGVAGLSETDADTDALLSRADHALYEAKSGGRNRAVVG